MATTGTNMNNTMTSMDAILSDTLNKNSEPVLKFKDDPRILTRVAILTGLPIE